MSCFFIVGTSNWCIKPIFTWQMNMFLLYNSMYRMYQLVVNVSYGDSKVNSFFLLLSHSVFNCQSIVLFIPFLVFGHFWGQSYKNTTYISLTTSNNQFSEFRIFCLFTFLLIFLWNNFFWGTSREGYRWRCWLLVLLLIKQK